MDEVKKKEEKSEIIKRQRRLIEDHLRQKMTSEEIVALAIVLKVKKAERNS